MAQLGRNLSPREVVIIDDSTRYGHELRDLVTHVLGQGRGVEDRATCISHQEAMSIPASFWGQFEVALVDAFDAHPDDAAIPVPVGDVVRRLAELEKPPRIVVYSANLDNPYLNRFVRDATNAIAYYDAACLLRSDGMPMRSALLDDQPLYQTAGPTAEEVGDLGKAANVAQAIAALRDDPQMWRWALGLTPWRAVEAYQKRKVRLVAVEMLKMVPAVRPSKLRHGQAVTDRSPDHGAILRVVQAALGLSRDRK